MDELTKYLSQSGVQLWMLPNSSLPLYREMPLNSENPIDIKYKDYFNRLTNTPINSVAKEYVKNHTVYRPEVIPKDKNLNQSTFQSFNNFLHQDTFFSNLLPAGISYHATVSMPDGIHLYGGLSLLHADKFAQKIKYISKNFTIPPENISLEFDYDLPLPLEYNKFASLAAEPNKYICKYEAESKRLVRIADLQDVKESQEDSESSTNSLAGSFMSSPRPLCCAAAEKLSDRFYVIYGGFDLIEDISFTDDNHCLIQKRIETNDQFWIFDSLAITYKEIKLSIHPTYGSIFPNSIARFGHSMVGIPLEKTNSSTMKKNYDISKIDRDYVINEKDSNNNNDDDDDDNINMHLKNSSSLQLNYSSKRSHEDNNRFSEPAILFIMGGFKDNDDNRSFIAMNDFWKCEIFLDKNGVSDEVVCCPIGNFEMIDDKFSYVLDNNGQQIESISSTGKKFSGIMRHSESSSNMWPAPRGHFSMVLVPKTELGELIFEDSGKESTQTSQSIERQLSLNPLANPIPKKTANILTKVSEGSNNFSQKTRNGSPISMRQQISQTKFFNSDIINDHSSALEGILSPLNFQTQNSSNATSISFLSESSIQTGSSTILRDKVLVLYGGSSIMFTRMEENEESNISESKKYLGYRSNSILGDFWWFDFELEKWFKFEPSDSASDLKICAHSMSLSSQHLSILGGIQARHYKPKIFKPICEDSNSEKNDIYKLVELFHQNLNNYEKNLKSNVSNFSSCLDDDIFNTQGLRISENGVYYVDNKNESSYYRTFSLNLNKKKWKSVDFAYVRNLAIPGVWNKNKRAINGGIINDTNQLLDKNDKPFIVLFTAYNCCILEDKVVLIAPDAVIIDIHTKHVTSECQYIWGNGVTEIYSS
ncbi:Gpb1 protein [Martiniozyma asiatica (nom. inval.)]|nr:Gpb1 protein [Martiniozyma asiatica]